MLLGVISILSSGCGQEDQKIQLADETKAFENTSNKIGNAIKAIADSLPYFEEGRPPIMQANLDVFWMNVTSMRLGLGRFLRGVDATPELQDVGRNLWIGRIQDNLSRAEAAGAFKADGQVALKLGASFGKERVTDELVKIVNLSTEIRTKLSIESGDSGSSG